MLDNLIGVITLVLITTEVLVKGGINTNSLNYGDNFNEMEEIRFWPQVKKTSNKPPPPEEGAKMARYIVHNSDWASLGSISSMPKIEGYPFTDVFSISDGPLLNSSGVPYLYMTPLDLSAKNIKRDNRCSLSLTLAQSNYCKENNFDPEDPRCAHVVLSGKIVEVKTGTDDEEFARKALFTRHPAMKMWPKDHHWFFAKLMIEKVCLLDYFGGPKYINVNDYFNAKV